MGENCIADKESRIVIIATGVGYAIRYCNLIINVFCA